MKYCSKCGFKAEKSHAYCIQCGKKNTNAADKNSSLDDLKRLYLITGNISILFGVFSMFVGMFVGFEYKDLLTDLLVVIVLNFPRLYFGLKLRRVDLNDLQYPLKVSLGMFIYTLIYTVLNISMGTGWLYLVLVYYYFKSYRETKKYLK